MLNQIGEERLLHLEKLKKQRPEYRPVLDLQSALERIIWDGFPATVSAAIEFPDIETTLKAGRPLFKASRLPLDLLGSFEILLGFSGVKAPNQAGFDAVMEYLASEQSVFNQAAMFITDGRDSDLRRMAERNDLDQEILSFLVRTALKPAFKAVNLAAENLIFECEWKQGFCPLCGSEPDMARLEAEGARTLHCGLCGCEWSFPRLECPYCRTIDSDQLSYLFFEDEPGYRVYTCLECKRYIITVDAGARSDPAPLDLEKLTVMHFDMLASSRGFH